MTPDRDLAWEGMVNVRDLGGLATGDDRQTAIGAVVRSDHPSRLNDAGWRALQEYGVRTIVTLTTAGVDAEEVDYGVGPPADVTIVRVDIEDGTDPDFVATMVDTGSWATPLAFADSIERWPDRCVTAVRAVAVAPPGGVLFHCTRGCDRTGLLALLVLHLVGVSPPDIAADYEHSAERLAATDPGCRDWIVAVMAERSTTVAEVIEATLAAVDVEAALRNAGLTDEDMTGLRSRLVTAS